MSNLRPNKKRINVWIWKLPTPFSIQNLSPRRLSKTQPKSKICVKKQPHLKDSGSKLRNIINLCLKVSLETSHLKKIWTFKITCKTLRIEDRGEEIQGVLSAWRVRPNWNLWPNLCQCRSNKELFKFFKSLAVSKADRKRKRKIYSHSLEIHQKIYTILESLKLNLNCKMCGNHTSIQGAQIENWSFQIGSSPKYQIQNILLPLGLRPKKLQTK